MPKHALLKRYVYATTTALLLLGLGSAAHAQNAPSFLGPIEGRTISSPAETATKSVLALNSMMFELYDDAAKVFQGNILKNHPVTLGLFTGAGGRFILYRPGVAPLEAPSVPIVYQLHKSLGHSTMALTEIVTSYLDNPDNQSWRSPMAAYRARMKAAVDGLDWKTMLGSDWDKAYAASNTIYVARQNNILFSVLAQYFGPEAINDRLMLIETISFTSSPEDMLTSLTHIIADRSVGALFFGNYYLMDYELMGGDARKAIIAEDEKRGMKPFLPPAVPFGSKQWLTLITPGPGPTSLAGRLDDRADIRGASGLTWTPRV